MIKGLLNKERWYNIRYWGTTLQTGRIGISHILTYFHILLKFKDTFKLKVNTKI